MVNDLRYAARLIRKAPLFTAAVVLTVGLGIGANTAIFSVVNAVMLRPLPFAEPARLMQVGEKNDTLHLPNFGASVLNYLSWKEQTQTFERLAAIGFATYTLSGRGDPEQFTGATISPSLLPVLGIKPVLGRSFQEGEDRPGAAPVALVSEGIWKRRFGTDRSLVGQTLTLNGIGYTIVGIAPPALVLLTGGDIWTPLTIDPGRERRLNHVISVVGRMKPGMTERQAQAEMDAIAVRVGKQYPEVKDWGIQLTKLYDTFVSEQLRTGLLVLLSAVGCVLLIACANVANLLLARAATRQKEIAIRTAMGASRARLLRQLTIESLVFSGLGGVAGVIGAFWGVRAINGALPPNLLPVPDVTIDGTVLMFAAALALGTGLVFGLAPAWHASKSDINAVLKTATRASTGASHLRIRGGVAAAELALATVLLIGAGLLIQSFVELQRVRVGFESKGVLTFQISLPPAKYGAAKAPRFFRDLLEAIRTVPAVRSAGVSSGIPFGQGNYTTTPVTTTGKSVLPPGTAIPINWRLVSPDFFRTMSIPLLRGRTFTDADDGGAAAVIIVSRETANRFWGADDPIGRTIRRVSDGSEFTVVGVVGDVRDTALAQESLSMYFSSAWRVWPLMDVVVRTDGGDPDSLVAVMRQKVRELDPELALSNVRPMAGWVAGSAAQPRLNAVLLAVFAAVALITAAIGIYGVLAYSVSQRTREIGLRMALGAPRGGVVRLIVREGMTVGLCGIAAGLVGALMLSGVLKSLVYGVAVRDPMTFVIVAAVLTLVAFAACSVPALRASRVDPMVSLRDE